MSLTIRDAFKSLEDITDEEAFDTKKINESLTEDIANEDYAQAFIDFIHSLDFKLEDYEDENNDEGRWGLIDLQQGGNLGDIEEDRFNDAHQIIDRLDTYIDDYYLSDEEWTDDDTYSLEDMIKSEKVPEDVRKMLDVIVNHIDEVDLTKAYELQNNNSKKDESIYDKGLSRDKENVLEFPNGEYFYVDVEDGKMFAGSATNVGITHDFEIDYDDDLDLDANLENLYNKMIDTKPELLDEPKTETCKINERNLTRAERHNRNMSRIFDGRRKQIEAEKEFLKGHGVSDEEVKKLADNTGLHGDALRQKIIDLGLDDDFKNGCKSCKESLELKEGISNFASFDDIPLYVFNTSEDVMEMAKYDSDYPKEEDFEDENGNVDYDKFDATKDEFINNYFDNYNDCVLVDDDDVESIKKDLKDLNSRLHSKAYSLDNEADDIYDTDKEKGDHLYDQASYLDDIRFSVEPGYYEAYQIYCSNDDEFTELDDEYKNFILNRLHDIATKYGLTELDVAFRLSNGETGYQKVESLKEGTCDEYRRIANEIETALRAGKTSPKYMDLIANYTTEANARKELRDLRAKIKSCKVDEGNTSDTEKQEPKVFRVHKVYDDNRGLSAGINDTVVAYSLNDAKAKWEDDNNMKLSDSDIVEVKDYKDDEFALDATDCHTFGDRHRYKIGDIISCKKDIEESKSCNESRGKGFIEKYKGYSIIDAGDVYVITDENGKNAAETKNGLPVIRDMIDDMISNKNECCKEAVEQCDFSDELINKVKAWCERLSNNKDGDTHFHYTYQVGKKYIKILSDVNGRFDSCEAFVDCDGNIYKAAGWRAPAKGVRATIDNAPDDIYSLTREKGRKAESYDDDTNLGWVVIERNKKDDSPTGGYSSCWRCHQNAYSEWKEMQYNTEHPDTYYEIEEIDPQGSFANCDYWDDATKDDSEFESIAEELAKACNEALGTNITSDDIQYDEDKHSLYVEGKVLNLPVGKFGAYMKESVVKSNGREKENTLDLGKLFEDKLARVESLLGNSIKLTESEKINVNDDKDVEKGKEILKDDTKENEEQIVDVDAETVDELKDSYIGNAILQCPVCRTLLYKKPDKLVKEEDTEIYNKDEECPHCGSKDGFNLVGQVASFKVEPEKEDNSTTGVEDDGKEDEVEVKTDDKDVDVNIETEESYSGVELNSFNKTITECLKSRYNNVSEFSATKANVDNSNIIIEGVIKFEDKKMRNCKFVFESKKDNDTYELNCINESFSKKENTFTIDSSIVDKCLVSNSFKLN